jgi:hypothetical protein
MIGASLNLPLPRRPRRTLTAVLQAMECARAVIGKASSWEKSLPWILSSFVNPSVSEHGTSQWREPVLSAHSIDSATSRDDDFASRLRSCRAKAKQTYESTAVAG